MLNEQVWRNIKAPSRKPPKSHYQKELLPIEGSEDEKIHCFQKEAPLSNGREEFAERATAFYAALGQGAPIDENDPFAHLEPDIFEEERNEIVVHED